jgi:hypothetical protein
MNRTEARRLAEQPNVKEYEARSREVQRKIEYLRRLRFAVQARQISDLSTTGNATD